MTRKQCCSPFPNSDIKEIPYEMYNNEFGNVSAIVSCDPTTELKMRFEKECKINSERAAELSDVNYNNRSVSCVLAILNPGRERQRLKVTAVIKRHPFAMKSRQSREKARQDIKNLLLRLPSECKFRHLPIECVLRILKQLPMTSILSLATTCKVFNSIINEQNQGIKDVNTIRIDFEEQRKNRVIVVSVKRNEEDPMGKVERYLHCTRCPDVDNELDEQLLKLPCSTEGVEWVANVLPALLVNAHISNIDFVGEHGVVLSHAFQFQKLSCKRRPYIVENLSFGVRTSVNSSVAFCIFWIQLLRPHKVKLYPLASGLFLTYSDLRWFLTYRMQKLILHDLYNVNLRAIREVLWDWYCGRQKDIPHTEIAFAGASPNLEEFLDRISHKITEEDEDGRYVFLKRPVDGEMKKLLVPSGESRLIISDYYDGSP